MDICLKPDPQKEMTLIPGPEDYLRVKDCERARSIVQTHPDRYTDTDFYDVAKCFYHQSDYDKAKPLFQYLVATPATSALVRGKALYALSKIASLDGQSSLAIQIYEDQAARNPADLDSLCQFARLSLVDSPSRPETDSMILHVFHSNPPDPWTYICVADYARASTTLRNAADIADASCRAILDHGDLDKNKAFSCLRDNAKRFKDRVNECRIPDINGAIFQEQERYWLARLAVNPKELSALRGLADYYYSQEKFIQAADLLEVIDAVGTEPARQAEVVDRLGRAYFRAGQDKMALATWSHLQQFPDQEKVILFNQAMVALVNRRYDEALKFLEGADLTTSPYYRLASGVRITDHLDTPDYSRVVKASIKPFEQALAWCDTHLLLYPEDASMSYEHTYANWRVKEAQGKLLECVTSFTDQVIESGRQWENSLSGVYLTYAALSYIHRAKGQKPKEAAADFETGEALLDEVFQRMDTLVASSDPLDTHNLMEAWLSLGWSKYYRDEFGLAAKVFGSVVGDSAIYDRVAASEKTEFDGNCDTFVAKFPRAKILPKQLVEAYRGLGASLSRLARKEYNASSYQAGADLAHRAVLALGKGFKIEADATKTPSALSPYSVPRRVIDGDQGVMEQSEVEAVRAGYMSYLHTFSPDVHTESRFNYAITQYWHAKILDKSNHDEALKVYKAAEREFKTVLAAAPEHAESYRFLEYIALVKRDYADGVKNYRKAFEFGTAEPADAARKMVDGATLLINRVEEKGAVLEASDSNNALVAMIHRVEFGVTLADHSAMEGVVSEAVGYAQELAKNEAICDSKGQYRDELSAMVTGLDVFLSGVSTSELRKRARIHQKVLSVLKDCLGGNDVRLPSVVSLATPRR